MNILCRRTSGFVDDVVFSYNGSQWARIEHELHDVTFRRSLPVGGIPDYQLEVGQSQCLVEFIRMQHWGED